MKCICGVLITATLLAGCGREAPAPDAPVFAIDRERISVSGISSGAYMAGQLHVAHSGVFGGAALLAGGPYNCARGELSRGLGPCLKGGDIGVETLVEDARSRAADGSIDALDKLADDPVWVFHGAKDAIVGAGVPEAAARFYELAAGVEPVTVIDEVGATHGFPTLATGAGCDEFAAPFLNACGYDAAGELLAALHGPLEPRVAASGTLVTVAQPSGAELLPEAFLYVPAACAAGENCGLHVALHGCNQSSEYIGDVFAAGAGYNEWAESNRLLVLYPQVAKSAVMPLNPQGCWDWWGYTDANYATQNGPQVRAIMTIIEALGGTAP